MRDEVYEEVAKATDYTGSKLIDGDDTARDRILAADDDLAELGRFWDESVLAVNENFKEMLISGSTQNVGGFLPPVIATSTNEPEAHAIAPDKPIVIVGKPAYVAKIEVSKSFDKAVDGKCAVNVAQFFHRLDHRTMVQVRQQRRGKGLFRTSRRDA